MKKASEVTPSLSGTESIMIQEKTHSYPLI